MLRFRTAFSALRKMEKMWDIPIQTLRMAMILVFGVLAFILVMLLPAFLEIKKPKDSGPRMIAGCSLDTWLRMDEMLILNMEKEERCDQIIVTRLTAILSVLPNLEA